METKPKTRKRRKVNIEKEIENIKGEQVFWQVSVMIGLVRMSLYYDDGVIMVIVKKKGEERGPRVKEDLVFNSYQYFLFRRAMFGLEVYDKDAIEHMHKQKKSRIEKVHLRAKSVIEEFVQKNVIWMTNKFLETFFVGEVVEWFLTNHSDVVTEVPEEDEVIITPRDLKISNKTIAEVLVYNHVLPDNFYQLTVLDDPRAKRLSQRITEPLDTL